MEKGPLRLFRSLSSTEDSTKFSSRQKNWFTEILLPVGPVSDVQYLSLVLHSLGHDSESSGYTTLRSDLSPSPCNVSYGPRSDF